MDITVEELIINYCSAENFNQRVQQMISTFPTNANAEQLYWAIHQYLSKLTSEILNLEEQGKLRTSQLDCLKEIYDTSISVQPNETMELISSLANAYDKIIVFIQLANRYFKLLKPGEKPLEILVENYDKFKGQSKTDVQAHDFQTPPHNQNATLNKTENSEIQLSQLPSLDKYLGDIQQKLEVGYYKLTTKYKRMCLYFYEQAGNHEPPNQLKLLTSSKTTNKFSWKLDNNSYLISLLITSQSLINQRFDQLTAYKNFLNDHNSKAVNNWINETTTQLPTLPRSPDNLKINFTELTSKVVITHHQRIANDLSQRLKSNKPLNILKADTKTLTFGNYNNQETSATKDILPLKTSVNAYQDDYQSYYYNKQHVSDSYDDDNDISYGTNL
jgi:hypothetical protein